MLNFFSSFSSNLALEFNTSQITHSDIFVPSSNPVSPSRSLNTSPINNLHPTNIPLGLPIPKPNRHRKSKSHQLNENEFKNMNNHHKPIFIGHTENEPSLSTSTSPTIPSVTENLLQLFDLDNKLVPFHPSTIPTKLQTLNSTEPVSSGNEWETCQKHINKVEKIFNAPIRFEVTNLFGFGLSLDAFLFFFTFLPLRALYFIFQSLFRLFSFNRPSPEYFSDFLHYFTFLVTCFGLTLLDASQAYHFIRAQSVIKLSVIYNSLEIFSKLCSAFGHDITAATFGMGYHLLQSTNPPHITWFKLITYLFIYILTSILQSTFLFLRVVTLNVAVNSQNNALLTLLLSNQFVELKSTVFKRFAKENLFQVACSDIVERFVTVIFVALIALQNLADAGWNFSDFLTESLLSNLTWILLSEIIVDWAKHAYIVRFNSIPYKIYDTFSYVLAVDRLVALERFLPSEMQNIEDNKSISESDFESKPTNSTDPISPLVDKTLTHKTPTSNPHISRLKKSSSHKRSFSDSSFLQPTVSDERLFTPPSSLLPVEEQDSVFHNSSIHDLPPLNSSYMMIQPPPQPNFSKKSSSEDYESQKFLLSKSIVGDTNAHSVMTRLGFTPLPFGCLIIRALLQFIPVSVSTQSSFQQTSMSNLRIFEYFFQLIGTSWTLSSNYPNSIFQSIHFPYDLVVPRYLPPILFDFCKTLIEFVLRSARFFAIIFSRISDVTSFFNQIFPRVQIEITTLWWMFGIYCLLLVAKVVLSRGLTKYSRSINRQYATTSDPNLVKSLQSTVRWNMKASRII